MKRSIVFFATCLSLFMSSCTNTSESSFVDGVTEALNNEGRINMELLEWTRQPQSFNVNADTLTITTSPHTDLWQRTYYHFRNDIHLVYKDILTLL